MPVKGRCLLIFKLNKYSDNNHFLTMDVLMIVGITFIDRNIDPADKRSLLNMFHYGVVCIYPQ